MKRVIFVLACCVPLFVHADLVHLKNGTTLNGVVKKTPEGWTVTSSDGKVTAVSSDAVKSISFIGRGALNKADDKLASLRRAVENVSDLKQIIERYKHFIATNPDAADEARRDLALWQDRLDRGLVKIGNEWVTPQQRDQLQEQSIAAVDDIRKLIKAGRLNEAEPALQKALVNSPQNPALLFLKGLLLYRQDQLLNSRKAFEAAKQQLSDHGPT